MTTALVLDRPTHGILASEYAVALHKCLPDTTVRHPKTTAEALDAMTDATTITSISLPDEVLDAADELRLFAGAATGYDHLPLETLREYGTRVINASSVHDPDVVEHVIDWLLMVTRRLDGGLRRQRRREWRRFQSYGGLQGSTATMVDLDAIGQAVVERLDAFGVETVGVRYTPEKGGPTDEILGFDDPESMLVRTDLFVVTCPLADETHDLIDRQAPSALPEHAILVNVARGGIIDTDALISHLQSNRLHTATLDVTDPEPLPEDHPLWSFGNAYITLHVSGHTPHYWTRVADILAEDVGRLVSASDGETPTLRNQVVPSPNPWTTSRNKSQTRTMTTLAFGLDATTYLAFCGAAVALILAPNPDTMYALACGLNGRGPGIRSALDIATGVLFHTFLATVGIAALFRTVPEAAAALRYVSVVYLGYLDVTFLRNDEFNPSVETGAGASFQRGVFVNTLNPKAALFFLAFLPGFAGQDAGAGIRIAGLGTTYATLTVLYLSVVALGADRLGSRLAETRVASTLSYVGAGMVLLLGIVLTLG